jgi:hypothetical protein
MPNQNSAKARSVLFLSDDPLIGIAVEVHSISMRGAEFTASRSLTISQKGELEFTRPDRGEPLRIALNVTWAAFSDAKGNCRAGCDWGRTLTADEMEWLATAS